MRNAYIDVRLELNEQALSMQQDPSAFIIETARDEADRRCAEAGGTLHTDNPPEILVEHGTHKLTGERCVLVATRWQVTVPERTPFTTG